MSRSYNKTPIFGNACYVSNKTWKQSYNRQYRHNEKIKLNNTDLEEYIESHYHDSNLGNVCSSNSDGFHYYNIYDFRYNNGMSIELKREHVKKRLRK